MLLLCIPNWNKFIAQKFNMCTKSGKKVIVFKITSMECLYQVKQGQVKQKQLEDGDIGSRQAHGCISSMDHAWWASRDAVKCNG